MSRVAVADIQPESAVVFQDSGDFPEDFHQLAGVFLRRAFGSELIGHTVVSGVVVGWRSYADAAAFVRQLFEFLQRVTL